MAPMKICLFLLLGTLIVRGQDTCDDGVVASDSKVCNYMLVDNSDIIVGLVCSNVRDSQDIVRSFRKVQDCGRMNKFSLENTTALVNLPTHLFEQMKFEFLLMTNVDLPFLGSPVEAASPLSPLSTTLYDIELRNVKYLHNWDWSKVEPMKVAKIEIYNSRFVKIQSSFSKPFPKLGHLKIENSNVHWIEDGAIPSSSLIDLELKKNFLKDLSIKAFSAKPMSLTCLDLRENQIEYLKKDLLDGLTVLRNLYLDGNKMFQFSEQVFESWKVGLIEYERRDSLTVYIAGTRLDEEDHRAIDKVNHRNGYNVEVTLEKAKTKCS